PVMAMGGYSGGDPILTPQSLADAVAENKIRFFFLPVSNLSQPEVTRLYPALRHFQTVHTGALSTWVAENCTAVPPAQWSSAFKQTGHPGPFQLYDCAVPPPCSDTAQACAPPEAPSNKTVSPRWLYRYIML